MTAISTAHQNLHVGSHDVRAQIRSGTDPASTPLLLCGGLGAPLDTLKPFVDSLSPEQDVIRFDVPGVGGSPTPALPYRFAQIASLAMGVVRALGYNHVDILGLSWGGALAQQIAFQYPRRCRRLVLVSTSAGSLMVPGNPTVLSKMMTPRWFLDPDYATHIVGELCGGSARVNTEAIYDTLARRQTAGSTRGYLYQLIAGLGWTSLPFLGLIRQETLVMAGDDDPIVPLVNGRILARMIPNARLHPYAGGHIELISDPKSLAPVVSDFLTDAAGQDNDAKVDLQEVQTHPLTHD